MVSDLPIVVYDACVLYSFNLRNLLVQLAVDGIVAARWTDRIHNEWVGSLSKTGKFSLTRILRVRDLMDSVLPTANVRNYEQHEGTLSLPDSNDRHVLAAAIEAHATIILTWNVKHFPSAELAKHNIAASDPDTFLTMLYRENAETVSAVVEAARANLRISEPTIEQYLQGLQDQGLKSFASNVRAGMSGKAREE
jgi:predicted nucleic acid-binding protein